MKLKHLLHQAERITAGIDPNTKQAEDDHKGDAAYETALKEASRKKAECEDCEEGCEDCGSTSVEETTPEAFETDTDNDGDDDYEGLTNADLIETLEDLKQGIEDAKVEMGDSPAAGVFEALAEVIDAIGVTQDAVSEDAMSDPAAQDAFKTASAFKAHFIRSRNLKAAKVISAELAKHQAAIQAKAKPKQASTAPTKRAFNPRSL